METAIEGTKTEVGSETCDQNERRVKKNVFFCRSIGIYMDTINIFIRILTNHSPHLINGKKTILL